MSCGSFIENNPAAFAACFCIVFITSCILFGVSWDVVNPNYVGIVYNHNTLHIDQDAVYSSGRYMLGLGRKFIQFPATWQTIRLGSEFGTSADAPDVLCRTSEGLVMRVEVSFTYQLSPKLEDLVRLYMDFGQKHEAVYILQAQAALRDACSLFTADEFIKNRTELANALHEKLIPRLNRSYALVPTLELVNMEFDAQYATAIELTQIARQDVLLALNEYAVAEVEANRSKAEAQTLASITIRNAYATNFSLAQQANAQAALLAFRIQQQTAALATLRRELGLNTSKQVLGYHFFAVLEEVATSKLTLGLPYPNTIQDLIGATAGP